MAIGTNLYISQAFGRLDEESNTFSFNTNDGIFKGLNTPINGQRSFGNGEEYKIYQLGIQTLPGVKIQLTENSNAPIFIGQTGIFEINLSDKIPLTSTITFMNLDELMKSSTGDESNKDKRSVNYCLIDVIYSKINEGGTVVE